jgi:integrase
MATFRKRGEKWQVQVRRKNQPSISRSFIQKFDAQCWARDMECSADRGELGELVLSFSHDLTLGDLLKQYRDEVISLKRGRKVETYIVNAILRQEFCSIKLLSLSSGPLTKYRDQRLKVVDGTTVKRELSILQHAFDIAVREWGWPIKINPVRSIRKPDTGNSRDRRLLPGEEGRVLRECRACKNPWIAPCVQLAIETAMRRSEILRMAWGDIDWDMRTLLILETKNGHPRTIPLTTEAVDLLKRLPRNIDGRVIPISANCLRMAWGRALRRADITGLRFHDLRHEAITRFFERGLSVPEVALISGHRDYRMLARYVHLRAVDVGKKLG